MHLKKYFYTSATSLFARTHLPLPCQRGSIQPSNTVIKIIPYLQQKSIDFFRRILVHQFKNSTRSKEERHSTLGCLPCHIQIESIFKNVVFGGGRKNKKRTHGKIPRSKDKTTNSLNILMTTNWLNKRQKILIAS